jgi:hypothetical protein
VRAPQHTEEQPVAEEARTGPDRDTERRGAGVDTHDVDEVQREVHVEDV